MGGGSPGVGVALEVLPQVPEEMLLGEEEGHAERQQLPALQENTSGELQVMGVNLRPRRELDSCSPA